MATLHWTLTNVKDDRVWISDDKRFRVQWAGRMTDSHPCERLWDNRTKRAYYGFKNEGQAREMAENLTFRSHLIWKVGLIACCGKKLDHPEVASKLYQSDLFKKAWAYCRSHYQSVYILSAKHGLIRSDQVVEPYDQKLNSSYIQLWACGVDMQLTQQHPCDGNTLYYAHAGQLYTSRLQYLYPMVFPLKGLGIGQQLAWYKQREK